MALRALATWGWQQGNYRPYRSTTTGPSVGPVKCYFCLFYGHHIRTAARKVDNGGRSYNGSARVCTYCIADGAHR